MSCRTSSTRAHRFAKADQPFEHWLCLHKGIPPTKENILKERAWVRNEGVQFLRDPLQIGRWLAYLEKLYWERGIPDALHGEDCEELMALQEPLDTRLFKTIFLADDFTHIEPVTLRRAYDALAKEHNISPQYRLKDRVLYAKLKVWLERNATHVVLKRVYLDGRIRHPEVYINSNLPQKDYSNSNNTNYVIQNEKTGNYTYEGPNLI
jgi:hypothetical protein